MLGRPADRELNARYGKTTSRSGSPGCSTSNSVVSWLSSPSAVSPQARAGSHVTARQGDERLHWDCGAPRRHRIPISGWKLMTRMSARRTGATMPANCFGAAPKPEARSCSARRSGHAAAASAHRRPSPMWSYWKSPDAGTRCNSPGIGDCRPRRAGVGTVARTKPHSAMSGARMWRPFRTAPSAVGLHPHGPR